MEVGDSHQVSPRVNEKNQIKNTLLGSYDRKKESKRAVAKRQRQEKARKNGTEENPRTEVRTSGETNSSPG